MYNLDVITQSYSTVIHEYFHVVKIFSDSLAKPYAKIKCTKTYAHY